MAKKSTYPKAAVKIYHGYGHTNNLIVYGHVLKGKKLSSTQLHRQRCYQLHQPYQVISYCATT